MKNTAKTMLKNWKISLLLFFVIMAIFAIHPTNPKGVTIRNVILDSAAYESGIISPSPTSTPVSKERIIAINNQPINTVEDYYDAIQNLKPNVSVYIETNKNKDGYILKTRPLLETLNETKTIIEPYFNETTNKTINISREVPKTKIIGTEPLGMSVYEAPTTNIRKGLDLQGGTRVLLKPETPISPEDTDIIITNLKQRLNVFGLSDIIIKPSADLSGNQYIIVEIAGASEQEVENLISEQGKFEAKIGEKTVFKGGDKDITHVCRTAECSGIDPRYGCQDSEDGTLCRFYFSITLSNTAANRQANATKNLEVLTENGNEYLSKSLELFLDDKSVDELKIGADLKGEVAKNIQISGSGSGTDRNDAILNTLNNMKKLQSVLITGSLPVKLNIESSNQISPVLGKEFVNNSLLVGFLAAIAVAIVIFIKYRKLKISIPMFITMLSEVLMLMGLAALIGWNIDIAAIAGIIITMGTGVDHLIVITDETLRGADAITDWKKRIKNAFQIIITAFFTTAVAMLPLWNAGAGLLRGFAITTIAGLLFGVFIARPAYAKIIEILLKK